LFIENTILLIAESCTSDTVGTMFHLPGIIDIVGHLCAHTTIIVFTIQSAYSKSVDMMCVGPRIYAVIHVGAAGDSSGNKNTIFTVIEFCHTSRLMYVFTMEKTGTIRIFGPEDSSLMKFGAEISGMLYDIFEDLFFL
jgi:hypothetical protein